MQEVVYILGILVFFVQQLVEVGIIEVWKIKGGYCCILLVVVYVYKFMLGFLLFGEMVEYGCSSLVVCFGNGCIVVLVIEDNCLQCELYVGVFGFWGLLLDLVYCDNGYKVLLEIVCSKFDVVLVDIVMEGMDGYEVVKIIFYDLELQDVSIVIVSSLDVEEMVMCGGILVGVVFFFKLVNFDELCGYMWVCCVCRECEIC